MTGTKVTVKVHAHYVQTIARTYGNNGLEYTEHAVVGATKPREILTSENERQLAETLKNWRGDDDYSITHEYLPEFNGYFEMQVMLLDSNDYSTFVVEEASYVDTRTGKRDLKNALQDPQLRRPIMTNILNAIAEKNVTRLSAILNAVGA